MEWEETGWRHGIKYLGFNEEASVSEVIFGVMQGHVKKDMSPKENASYKKVIEKVQYFLPIYHIIKLPWSILDSLRLVTSNTVQNTSASLCNIHLFF